MVKEEKILTQTTKYRKYCDDCGKEITRGLACSVALCEYCKKDLCEKCIGYEEETWGDFRTVYCKTCWELGNEYRPKIEELHNEIDKLYKEWQDKCKNK
jgi:hypothetical protein